MADSTASYSRPQIGRLIVFGGAALCLGLAVNGWLSAHRGETIPAILEARTTAVTASREYRLVEVFAQSGTQVEAGQPLLRFVDERLDARISAKLRELTETTAELHRVSAAADVEIAWRRRELQGEIYETQLQLAQLLQLRVSRQVEQLAWQEHLQELSNWTGSETSDLRVQPVTLSRPLPDAQRLQALLKEDAAAAALQGLESQVTLAETRLNELTALTKTLEDKVRISVGIDVAKSRLERVEAELAALEEQRAALTVCSVGHGTVGLWHKQPGDRIAPGETVVELLDEAQLSLKAFVPSALVGKVASGQQLTLLFPGNSRRRGIVDAIPPQASESGTESADAQLPLRIHPAGKLWPKLPVGSRVNVLLPEA